MLLPSGNSSAHYREVSLTAHLVASGPPGAPSCACGPASQWRDSWFVTHDMTCVSPAEMQYLRRQSQSCSISLTIMCRRAASMTLVLTGACNGRETHPAGTQAILTQVNGPVWPKTRLLQMREDCRPRLRVSWSYCRHVVAGSLEGVLLVTEPGVVFTKDWVVDFVLDVAGYTVNNNLLVGCIVEPSCGDGAFPGRIVSRLCERAVQDDALAVEHLLPCVRAFDLDDASVSASRMAIRRILSRFGLSEADSKRLADAWVSQGDFLMANVPAARWVVGNPHTCARH